MLKCPIKGKTMSITVTAYKTFFTNIIKAFIESHCWKQTLKIENIYGGNTFTFTYVFTGTQIYLCIYLCLHGYTNLLKTMNYGSTETLVSYCACQRVSVLRCKVSKDIYLHL